MEMREVFVEKLAEAMERDDKIVVIDADLAKSTKTWGLRKTFPDRALDVGIAEQNMASIAAVGQEDGAGVGVNRRGTFRLRI